ncbi:MAG: DUF3226 domain-containing protein [Jaaginema sp. PMC 1079.18]|nr:DUF3226 domain-containing protein [Jaaginema sp. PMC 1080.18]MEC4854040.1 DUF3226 domain-containing protein [Jaaginema sp. PMC 1079.18]MEC4869203.1 DUF3226 domain-containing protein [Jaaginema sp. PMC 1078.18]
MATRYYPKKLIVEGQQDKRVIPELIEAYGIPWEKAKRELIVYIQSYGSDNFIDTAIISTELKASSLEALGIIIDADKNPEGRWQSIRNACLPSIPEIPQDLPATGLVQTTPNNIQFGIWIMPDNQLQGMLETFLSYLIPDESEALWQYAQTVVLEAKKHGATYKDVHLDKANIYTWLAWQNPPGRQLQNAIQEQIFQPGHPTAQKFVDWFRKLYRIRV